MLNRMAKWAIGLSIVALLAAIGSAFYHGTVRFGGAASGWVSGIGSLSGALVALGIALYSDFKDRRDRRGRLTESRAKAARRAKRVSMSYPQQLEPGRGSVGSIFTVRPRMHNGSGSPLYEVKCYEPLVVFPKQSWGPAIVYHYTTAVVGDTKTRVQDANPQVVESGTSYEMWVGVQGVPEPNSKVDKGDVLWGDQPWEWVEDEEGNLEVGRRGVWVPPPLPDTERFRPFSVYPIAAFEDDDGNRFGWTLYRTAGKPDDEISGRWEFVDDNYPFACTGVLRELLDQAQSWPLGG